MSSPLVFFFYFPCKYNDAGKMKQNPCSPFPMYRRNSCGNEPIWRPPHCHMMP
jgi:hypothetical protein